jgi:hypothetical protein
MQTNTMAFNRAPKGAHHPAPWVALPGSSGTDIEVELSVQPNNAFKDLEPHSIVYLVTSLIRIAYKPDINAVILAKCHLNDIPGTSGTDSVAIYETRIRYFRREVKELTTEVLDWIKDSLRNAIELLKNEQYKILIDAFDYAQYNMKSSTSMIAIWGALEQIFSPNPGEIRYRVGLSLSSYLEEAGEARYSLYKKVLKLYDKRSKAAHKNSSLLMEDLVDSFYILDRVILKITENKAVPTQEELEKKLLWPDEDDA